MLHVKAAHSPGRLVHEEIGQCQLITQEACRWAGQTLVEIDNSDGRFESTLFLFIGGQQQR
jgi:hypothetical protein